MLWFTGDIVSFDSFGSVYSPIHYITTYLLTSPSLFGLLLWHSLLSQSVAGASKKEGGQRCLRDYLRFKSTVVLFIYGLAQGRCAIFVFVRLIGIVMEKKTNQSDSVQRRL